MKISWPRRELVWLSARVLFLGMCGVSAFKQWDVSRSSHDLVTLVLSCVVSSLIILRIMPQLWKLVCSNRFEVAGATLKVKAELAPAEVLLLQPLQGVAGREIIVRLRVHLKEQPGKPYQSFQIAPSPIHHALDSSCEVILLDTSQSEPMEVVRKTMRIATTTQEDSEIDLSQDVEMFVERHNDWNSYALRIEPLLPEVVSFDGERKLKWQFEVTLVVLVEKIGIYEDVRLEEAQATVLPVPNALASSN